MARPLTQRGFSLVELMIGIGVVVAIAALSAPAALRLWEQLKATELTADLQRVSAETRSVWGDNPTLYTNATAANLIASSTQLDDLRVGTTGLRVGDATLTIAAATELAGGVTGRAGDAFALSFGTTPGLCRAVLRAYQNQATRIGVTAGGEPVGALPAGPTTFTAAQIDAACPRTAETVTVRVVQS